MLAVLVGVDFALHAGHIAEVPLQQVQVVDRLRHQHPAAVRSPGAAPAGGRIVFVLAVQQHRDLAEHRGAQCARIDLRPQFGGRRPEAALEQHPELHSGLGAGLHHLFGRRHVHRDGFLAQHVHPGRRGGQHHLRRRARPR